MENASSAFTLGVGKARATYRNNKCYWLPGVAGTQPRLSSPVIGGSILNKGACTSPLYFFVLVYYFSKASRRFPGRFFCAAPLPGFLPLLWLGQKKRAAGGGTGRSGVGDGGYGSGGQSDSPWFRGAGPSTALASSRTTHRSKIMTIISPASRANRAPDHSVSVPETRRSVTSSRGSFRPVLRSGTFDTGRRYYPRAS